MTTTKYNIDHHKYSYIAKIVLILGLILESRSVVVAQGVKTKQKLRSATKQYGARDYEGANKGFGEALTLDSTSIYAHYGLGNSFFQQDKYEEAARHYERILSSSAGLSREKSSAVLHNMGNIAMRSKQYDLAIDYYQKALIQMPSDDDTRYNLVLAQKLKQQQDQKQEDKEQQDNKQQEKDNQQKEQQHNNNDTNQQNKPQQPQKEEPSSSSQQQEDNLTPQQAEQILNAFKQNDERTRKKVEQLQRKQESERNNQTRRKW